jgi:hypothetical protein
MNEINARRQIRPSKGIKKAASAPTSSLTGNFQFPYGKEGQGTMKQWEVMLRPPDPKEYNRI